VKRGNRKGFFTIWVGAVGWGMILATLNCVSGYLMEGNRQPENGKTKSLRNLQPMKHQRLANVVHSSSPLNTPFGDKPSPLHFRFSGCLIGRNRQPENGKAQTKKRFTIMAKRFLCCGV